MPINDVVQTIVFEDEKDSKKITDFISFYNLPSQILTQEGHDYTYMKVSHIFLLIYILTFIQVAYLYYYGVGENSLTEMMKYALHYAKQQDYDVFNCLQIMDNS